MVLFMENKCENCKKVKEFVKNKKLKLRKKRDRLIKMGNIVLAESHYNDKISIYEEIETFIEVDLDVNKS